MKVIIVVCLLLFGCQGPTGPEGEKGDTGSRGAQGPQGGITRITAGPGLAGGGTSGELSLRIGAGAITNDMVAEKTITLSKLNSVGASSGQVLMYNGSNIVWNTFSQGGSDSGTITGITAGTGLSGGGSSGIVNLMIDTNYADSRYVNESQANSIINSMIRSGQVVKSINNIRDDLTLSAGTNINITQSGNTITFSSSAAGGDGIKPGDVVEYNGQASDALEIRNNTGRNALRLNNRAQTGSDATLYVRNEAGGNAGYFLIFNPGNNEPALNVSTNGTGEAGRFSITNSGNGNNALMGKTTGTGSAGYFQIDNAGSNAYALHVKSNGQRATVRIDRSSAQYSLEVGGVINCESVNTYSDCRWKTNITQITDALASVLNMRGVLYEWKAEEYPEKQFSTKRQIGVIAQEIESVVPELVTTDESGYKSVSYQQIIPVLIEAIKEQQSIIENQQTQIDFLMSRINGNDTRFAITGN